MQQLSIFDINTSTTFQENSIAAKNYLYPPDFAFPNGKLSKAANNLAAIATMKRLDAQQRPATTEERAILAQYLGWGVAPDVFEEPLKPEWQHLGTQLRELLTQAQYKAARASIVNAYYTSPIVISEIYQGLKWLGFKGGKQIETSMGSGLYLGFAPEDISTRATWTGVELDPTTGRIAQLLYPRADIYIQGFEDVTLPDNHFDLAISNVPFGAIAPNDPYFHKIVHNLHDYFFVKALRLVRPGGLVAFITSVGTLQSRKSRKVREYISASANLVGAMRLPCTAFKEFALTEVTTDLVILQKRLHPELEPDSTDWMEVVESGLASDDGDPLMTSAYYTEHPEMLLGVPAVDQLYGNRNRLGLKADGRNLAVAMREAFRRLPPDIYREPAQLATNARRCRTIVIPPDLQGIKPFSFVWHDNQPWQALDGKLHPVQLDGIQRLRLYWLVQIRNAVKAVFEVQVRGGTDEELSRVQKRLNCIYDQFVSRYDWLHSAGNWRVFADDPEYPLLLALEDYDRDKQKATKTDIFCQRTITEYKPHTSASTASIALVYSLSEKGRIDIGFIAGLLGHSAESAIAQLQQDQLIYRDPEDPQLWYTADEYLSGDVRSKLHTARAVASVEPDLAVNVEALLAVQPKDLLPGDIYVRLGTPWLPGEVIREFIAATLNVPPDQIHVYQSRATATWDVDLYGSVLNSKNNTEIHGIRRVPAHRLVELALNLQVPVVRDEVDGKYVENAEATRLAQNKQETLKEAFKKWVWSDLGRADRLAKLYNEQYNCLVPRSFDGSHLELPGMNPAWRSKMRPHQLNAIWRIICNGNTLVNHAVGGGKTAVAIAAAVELKRLGLCHKPALVVMDHLPEQMASEALQMYPRLRVLIAGSTEMTAAKRQEMAGRIATGNWDLVIISHTAFSKLRLSPKMVQQVLAEKSALVEADYLAVKGDGERTKGILKNLEKKLDRLSKDVAEVANDQSKDNTVYFDTLGLDYILYDESQAVKALSLNTKMERVLGVPSTSSYRAEDFYQKCRYLAERHEAEKGIVLLTATPITNTMAEAWVNQVYLQYKTLQKLGLLHFDAWVSNFAEIKVGAEITPQGTLEVKSRLALFHNLPEWRQLFAQVADIVSDEDLQLPKPGKEYVTVEVPATPEQLQFFSYVAHRAEATKAGRVQPDKDNMPRITGHIRQGVVDLRLLPRHVLQEFLSAEEIAGLVHCNSKVTQCIDNIFRIWQETQQERLTQLVFCDVGTPHEKGERFCVYDCIKSELARRGVPVAEIAFIHDAKTDEQKNALFRAVRFGKIRIFLGSTSKMGVGTNVQNYVIAAHDLDCPWRPTDHIQREGRSVRQGNINPKVIIYRYVTQGKPYQDATGKRIAGLSPDGYLYQTSVTKARFIEDALNGRNTARSVEDCTDIVLSYAEVMATATGDRRLMRKVELDAMVAKLSQEERDHINNQVAILRSLERLPFQIELATARVSSYRADRERVIPTDGDKFRIWIEGGEMTRRTLAGERLCAIAQQLVRESQFGTFTIGSFAGLQLHVRSDVGGCTLHLVGDNTYSAKIGTPLGTIASLEHCAANGIDKEWQSAAKHLQELQRAQRELSAQTGQSFAKAEALQTAIKEQVALNEELGLYADDAQVLAQAA